MEFCCLNSNIIKVIKNILHNNFKVKKAAIFGSRAKNNFTEKSDIDIVIFDNNITVKELANIKAEFLESSLPYFVDVILFDKVNKKFQQEIMSNYIELL